LGGRTLGLVGFGNIARIVADIARGFGMRLTVADPFVDDSVVTAAGATLVSFDDLVATSDVISLHVPLTDDTAHLVDADVLRRMRQGAILVNTSRGGLIDESALLDALTDGHLGGAALDVLSGESIDMKNPLPYTALSDHNAGLDNLIITPHIAGQTDRALLTAGREAVDCIRTALAGRAPRNAVAPVSPDATPADARR
ncbi:2-hydroxyacid dehydrogenase, partial [Rhodococcus sp. MEB064]|uniref:2-hydroxyacid dehydrogenase n=1 Tax=Rhodococcus sp. MEB064 TaxID=1587522 RepID=UPI0005AC3241